MCLGQLGGCGGGGNCSQLIQQSRSGSVVAGIDDVMIDFRSPMRLPTPPQGTSTASSPRHSLSSALDCSQCVTVVGEKSSFSPISP